jgi:DNA-binding MarR family transcriptional regulator
MCSYDFSDPTHLPRRFMRVIELLLKRLRPDTPERDIFGRLAPNQFHALHLLQHEPGMTQKTLAERLRVTPAAVSTAVRELESLGLVERRRGSDDDRRTWRLYLSEKGSILTHESLKRRCAILAEVLLVLPEDEQQMVVEALERALRLKRESDTPRTESAEQ